MKVFLFSSIMLTCSLAAVAQALRYQIAIFDSVVVTKDIQYGEADFYDANSVHTPAPLKLDFYQPFGDTLAARPLVITIFGGAFLAGGKEWSDMVAWCDSLSQYGYACASIQYRLSYNVVSPESVVRASYRAVQDTRAAIRFLEENASTYGIDTNKIFLLGNSAGSITALLTAFITKDSERPAPTYGFGTTSDADDLGCLDCSGNSFSHQVKLAGIVSLWGGMWDIDLIEADESLPALLVHGTADDRVPCDTGHAFGIGFTPFVYGSIPIAERMAELGIPFEFHPFDSLKHAFYMDNEGFTFPNQYWDTVFTLGHEFLYKVVSGTFTNISPDKTPVTISIYPNPAHGFISIKAQSENAPYVDIWLTDVRGAKVQSWHAPAAEAQLDVSSLPPGIYLLHILSGKVLVVKKVALF